MDIWALIPVKFLHESKQRLAHLLTIEQRSALIQHCLQRELSILNEVEAVTHTLVISSDAQVLSLAEAYGAFALLESAPQGLNSAVTTAAAAAVNQGAEATLIVPADLPFIQVEDVEKMITAVAAPQLKNVKGNGRRQAAVAICSDKHNQGTNALLLNPPDGFVFHYGPDSFRDHIAEAQRLNRQLTLVSAPNLQFDLDTEQDWLAYEALVS